MSVINLGALTELRSMFLIRGLAAIFFGILLLIWPKMSLLVMLSVFWLIMFIDAGIQLSAAFQLRRNMVRLWFLPVIAGSLEIAAGIYFLLNLDQVGVTVLIILSTILFVRAIGELILIIDPSLPGRAKILFVGLGFLSALFAILFAGLSTANPLDIAKVLGIYELCSGLLRIAASFGFWQESHKVSKV